MVQLGKLDEVAAGERRAGVLRQTPRALPPCGERRIRRDTRASGPGEEIAQRGGGRPPLSAPLAPGKEHGVDPVEWGPAGRLDKPRLL